MLFLMTVISFCSAVRAQVELPSSVFAAAIGLKSSMVRFNQFGSNRVEGLASGHLVTTTREEDDRPGLFAAFSQSTEDIDKESPSLSLKCWRSFYVQSRSQTPVMVQMTVKGTVVIDYNAALLPGYNMEHGYFAGGLRAGVTGNLAYRGPAISGIQMEKSNWDVPKIEAYMGASSGSVAYRFNIKNDFNNTTNVLVWPNQLCEVFVDIAFSHGRNSSFPVWDYQRYTGDGELAVQLTIDPADAGESKLIMGIARPDLSFEKQESQLIIKYTGVLQSAESIDGPFADVPNAQSPYPEKIGSGRFFRARF